MHANSVFPWKTQKCKQLQSPEEIAIANMISIFVRRPIELQQENGPDVHLGSIRLGNKIFWWKQSLLFPGLDVAISFQSQTSQRKSLSGSQSSLGQYYLQVPYSLLAFLGVLLPPCFHYDTNERHLMLKTQLQDEGKNRNVINRQIA